MRGVIVALSAAALLIAAAVSAASATGPQAATITSVMTVTGNGTNTGTFEATGPAVSRHLICAAGTVTDVYIDFSDPSNFPVVKAFVCSGGGPTFLMWLPVHEGFTWAVQGGSGPYGTLFGSGLGTSIVVDPETPPFTDTDTYTGTLVNTGGQNAQ